ncbi:PREDICTED: ankyrin repeat domain-containing protein 1-like [Amphimedon queenslandica]|nr:PREDICTED: ankyrin repeat domain-containing protein 1-like [Amphimedon queenslandica]XP_019856201.1 PREDICTED: ankyrin repeat domain-containing protein 1-like [Amphimedon queenslandica]|eukprot:XP_019856200.1 PREDICTED: ankyrin repeat domain-containing protein 1-like [Amphimedon queenslandica]
MATSDSEKVQESSSNQYRRSASPEVVCFSEPEIMSENDKTTIKGPQREGDIDFRQYHLDVDTDEDDESSNEGEGEEVDKELEGQEQEFEEELMNAFIVDPSSVPQNLPNVHTNTRKISGVSLTGYQRDEEVLSEDDHWLSRPRDNAGMTRLHSQELLNELFFKFKYVHSSLKHHGRRRTFRKRAATESTGKVNALDMIQKRNSDAIITIDHSLSEEEEDDKELEKKKEGERERARRATMQADSSLYDTKKRKKERKILESIGAGVSMSPRQRKTRAQSVAVSGPSGNNRYKPSSSDLSLLDRKKPPGSPKAPHLPKLKLHNPKSAEKLRKYLEMKKYDQVQRDERMDTPLHAIVRSDRKDKLECLLILMVFSDYGTDNIDMPAAFGNTALHIAVQKGDLLMVQLLLVFGANIDAMNDQKRTPLDMLINKGNDKKFLKSLKN